MQVTTGGGVEGQAEAVKLRYCRALCRLILITGQRLKKLVYLHGCDPRSAERKKPR